MRTILLIDDDRESHLFVRFALKPLNEVYRLESVTSALEGMQYLLGEAGFREREAHQLPDLILLDLKMPIMDGFQWLEWMRSQPQFGHLPVVVLTGSSYQADIIRAHRMGANSFVVKAVELLDFVESIRNVLGMFFDDPEPVIMGTQQPWVVSPTLLKSAY